MKILTIDSTLNNLYLSLGNSNGDFFESKTIQSQNNKYHSAYIANGIAELLKNHALSPEDLDAIGVNIGPGSFTGIRVGMTTSRVLAQAHNLKAVGVPSLEILSKYNNSDLPTLVLMDARKNKAYCAIYKEKNLSPCSIDIEEAQKLAKSGKYFTIIDKNMQKYLDISNKNTLIFEENPKDLGRFLFEITTEKLSTNSDFNWAKLKPLYIQPPPITLKKP